ncbi:MAG: hypothetical protein HYZ54_09190 [Ignavibacteriae bacterium]|nr:hypothetical protein [Ignavibacteriota bacterium]
MKKNTDTELSSDLQWLPLSAVVPAFYNQELPPINAYLNAPCAFGPTPSGSQPNAAQQPLFSICNQGDGNFVILYSWWALGWTYCVGININDNNDAYKTTNTYGSIPLFLNAYNSTPPPVTTWLNYNSPPASSGNYSPTFYCVESSGFLYIAMYNTPVMPNVTSPIIVYVSSTDQVKNQYNNYATFVIPSSCYNSSTLVYFYTVVNNLSDQISIIAYHSNGDVWETIISQFDGTTGEPQNLPTPNKYTNQSGAAFTPLLYTNMSGASVTGINQIVNMGYCPMIYTLDGKYLLMCDSSANTVYFQLSGTPATFFTVSNIIQLSAFLAGVSGMLVSDNLGSDTYNVFAFEAGLPGAAVPSPAIYVNTIIVGSTNTQSTINFDDENNITTVLNIAMSSDGIVLCALAVNVVGVTTTAYLYFYNVDSVTPTFMTFVPLGQMNWGCTPALEIYGGQDTYTIVLIANVSYQYNLTLSYTSLPTATVGPTQNICGLTSNPLGGNTPTVGTGVWSMVSGPGAISFSNPSSGYSTATASIEGTYVLQWTINLDTDSSSADITVTYNAVPTTATVGKTQTIEGTFTSKSLDGNKPTMGTGAWSFVSGPGQITFSDASSGNSTATATVVGNYVVCWTISNGICDSSANLDINFYEKGTDKLAKILEATLPSSVAISLILIFGVKLLKKLTEKKMTGREINDAIGNLTQEQATSLETNLGDNLLASSIEAGISGLVLIGLVALGGTVATAILNGLTPATVAEVSNPANWPGLTPDQIAANINNLWNVQTELIAQNQPIEEELFATFGPTVVAQMANPANWPGLTPAQIAAELIRLVQITTVPVLQAMQAGLPPQQFPLAISWVPPANLHPDIDLSREVPAMLRYAVATFSLPPQDMLALFTPGSGFSAVCVPKQGGAPTRIIAFAGYNAVLKSGAPLNINTLVPRNGGHRFGLNFIQRVFNVPQEGEFGPLDKNLRPIGFAINAPNEPAWDSGVINSNRYISDFGNRTAPKPQQDIVTGAFTWLGDNPQIVMNSIQNNLRSQAKLIFERQLLPNMNKTVMYPNNAILPILNFLLSTNQWPLKIDAVKLASVTGFDDAFDLLFLTQDQMNAQQAFFRGQLQSIWASTFGVGASSQGVVPANFLDLDNGFVIAATQGDSAIALDFRKDATNPAVLVNVWTSAGSTWEKVANTLSEFLLDTGVLSTPPTSNVYTFTPPANSTITISATSDAKYYQRVQISTANQQLAEFNGKGWKSMTINGTETTYSVSLTTATEISLTFTFSKDNTDFEAATIAAVLSTPTIAIIGTEDYTDGDNNDTLLTLLISQNT